MTKQQFKNALKMELKKLNSNENLARAFSREDYTIIEKTLEKADYSIITEYISSYDFAPLTVWEIDLAHVVELAIYLSKSPCTEVELFKDPDVLLMRLWFMNSENPYAELGRKIAHAMVGHFLNEFSTFEKFIQSGESTLKKKRV